MFNTRVTLTPGVATQLSRDLPKEAPLVELSNLQTRPEVTGSDQKLWGVPHRVMRPTVLSVRNSVLQAFRSGFWRSAVIGPDYRLPPRAGFGGGLLCSFWSHARLPFLLRQPGDAANGELPRRLSWIS